MVSPIIIAVAVISLLSAGQPRDSYPPPTAANCRDATRTPWATSRSRSNRVYDGCTNVLLDGRNIFADHKRLEAPRFPGCRPNSRPATAASMAQNSRPITLITGCPEGNQPGGYLFAGVHEPKHLDARSSLFFEGRPVLITPRERPAVAKPGPVFLGKRGGFRSVDRCGHLQATGLDGPVDPRPANPAWITARMCGLPLVSVLFSRFWT